MAPGSLHGLSGLLEPFRCRLCRRIAGVVFLSILLVEGAILVPSYFSFRDDLHDRLRHAGAAALSAAYTTQMHARTTDLLITGRLMGQREPVRGGRLYEGDELLGTFGEAPAHDRASLSAGPRRVDGGRRYEVYYSPEELGIRFGIVARLDAEWIGPELTAFVWRISGLVLLISVVVCATTMLIVGRKAMAPMLRLRDHLAAAHDDPANSDARRFPSSGDEWDEVGAAVDRLLARVARTHREDLALMSALAEQASDAIVAYDHHGRIVYANAACRELAGCDSVAEMQAEGLPRLRLPGETAARPLPTVVHAGMNGTRVLVEGRDGRTVPCLLQAPHLDAAHEGPIHSYIHLTDISDLQAAQERLEEQNLELAAANRAKSEFLANVSHELRTPLNAVIGFAEVLRDQAFRDSPNAQFREYAEDIRLSGSHLLSLINDILDLSKIEAGRYELTETALDPGEALETAVRLVRGREEAKALTLQVDVAAELPRLYADSRAVKQILINLLSNSVKFTPAGKSVTACARQRSDGGIDLIVADEGAGMDPDAVAEMFQPFRRADRAFTRQVEGTGLGLPLVQSLAQLHGGSVEVDTALGQGTRVTVRFPPERTVARADGTSSAAARAIS